MIKYDEPRTWWRVNDNCDVPIEMNGVIGETKQTVVCADGRRIKKQTHKHSLHDTRRNAWDVITSRETGDTNNSDRTIAALAACDGIATEHLTPGCVAKLVEALERISERSEYGPGDFLRMDICNIAKTALATMKGV